MAIEVETDGNILHALYSPGQQNSRSTFRDSHTRVKEIVFGLDVSPLLLDGGTQTKCQASRSGLSRP